MAKIEEELKQNKFPNEQTKAHLNILFTSNWLHNKTSIFLKCYNLTPEQFNVLRILRGKHPESMCQKDILQRMLARQSNISLIVKKLASKKFIEVNRSELDRRAYVIAISEAGLAVLNQIDKRQEKEMLPTAELSDSEAFHLNALLNKLRGG